MAQKFSMESDSWKSGIIDIHSHVLPGLDDGAKTMRDSIAMLWDAYRQGVRVVIATPHYESSHWRTKPEQIQRQLQKLSKRIENLMPDMKLYAGQEIQYFDSMADMLLDGKLLTLAGSRYVLTEFLPKSPWSQIQGGVRKLVLAGYVPVLAHIERYEALRENDRLEELRREGALLQMNGGSLIGKKALWDIKGRRNRKWCRRTLLSGKIRFLGSDMHGVHHRRPNSGKALAWIRKAGGEELARQLAMENPGELLPDRNMRKETAVDSSCSDKYIGNCETQN